MTNQTGCCCRYLAYTLVIIFLSSCTILRKISTTKEIPLKYRPNRLLREIPPGERRRELTAGRESVERLMNAAVQDSVFPGAVLLVARHGLVLHHKAYGNFGYNNFARPLNRDAIFDLASVTKVVATTSAAMVLGGDGLLLLDQCVADFIPEFRQGQKSRITIRHLLTHSSGLPPYIRYFLEDIDSSEIIKRIFNEPLIYEPGTAYKYSDLGMIILGKIIEQISGTTLNAFCRQRVFAPLQMEKTFFNPPGDFLQQIPPTEFDAWRGRMVHGEVHDENAFALGGVAGHAGLFSTAADLAKFCQMLLNGGGYAGEKILHLDVLRQFITRQNITPESTRALGWDTRSEKGSSSGDYLSQSAFGHTGFTGTSLWLDPEKDLFIILLSNRVHPTRANKKIIEFRPQLHNLVMEKLININ